MTTQKELRTKARQCWQELQRANKSENALSVANLLDDGARERLPHIRRLQIALEEQPVQDQQAKWFRKLVLTCFLEAKGVPDAFPALMEELTTLEALEQWAKTWDVSWYGRGNGLCGEARVTDSLLQAVYFLYTVDRQGHFYTEGDRTFLSAFASWLLQATFPVEMVQFFAKRDAPLIQHSLNAATPNGLTFHRLDHQQDAFEVVLSFSRMAAELAPGYWVVLALWLSTYLCQQAEDERPLSWKDLDVPNASHGADET